MALRLCPDHTKRYLSAMEAAQYSLNLLREKLADLLKKRERLLSEVAACDSELAWLKPAIAFLEVNVNRTTATALPSQPSSQTPHVRSWRDTVHDVLMRQRRFVPITDIVEAVKDGELPPSSGIGTTVLDSVRTALRALASEESPRAVLYKHNNSRKNAFWGRPHFYDEENKRPYADYLPEGIEAQEPHEGGSIVGTGIESDGKRALPQNLPDPSLGS